MHATLRRLGGTLALTTLLIAATAGAAQAKVIDSGSWDDSGTDVDVCGQYTVDWHSWGTFKIEDATDATDGQFFPDSYRANFSTVVRNPDNDKTFTEHFHSEFHEYQIRPLGDGLIAYKSIEAALYTVETARGRTVYADPSIVVQQWKYDSLNDSQPGGNVLDGYPKELVNTVDQQFDFCKLAAKLIG